MWLKQVRGGVGAVVAVRLGPERPTRFDNQLVQAVLSRLEREEARIVDGPEILPLAVGGVVPVRRHEKAALGAAHARQELDACTDEPVAYGRREGRAADAYQVHGPQEVNAPRLLGEPLEHKGHRREIPDGRGARGAGRGDSAHEVRRGDGRVALGEAPDHGAARPGPEAVGEASVVQGRGREGGGGLGVGEARQRAEHARVALGDGPRQARRGARRVKEVGHVGGLPILQGGIP